MRSVSACRRDKGFLTSSFSPDDEHNPHISHREGLSLPSSQHDTLSLHFPSFVFPVILSSFHSHFLSLPFVYSLIHSSYEVCRCLAYTLATRGIYSVIRVSENIFITNTHFTIYLPAAHLYGSFRCRFPSSALYGSLGTSSSPANDDL